MSPPAPRGRRGWKKFYAVLKGMILYLQKVPHLVVCSVTIETQIHHCCRCSGCLCSSPLCVSAHVCVCVYPCVCVCVCVRCMCFRGTELERTLWEEIRHGCAIMCLSPPAGRKDVVSWCFHWVSNWCFRMDTCINSCSVGLLFHLICHETQYNRDIKT